ncbi:PREDICTED: uncharacterized protein LOC109590782 isoform X1 [Amphimedon queenslandica]|uniref:Uncharacterized protein n=1 Tax=Amphimedon queenslandica TaxID=400682 RepID=A0AAN0JYZ0_AMPQE|nr:PREDICTED: uncharacterized protein LOC109590782 isoform X1 [Amphimedon queenslandica]|eukprot:XP_019862215.1 PREDICTED: uncharacterized protein LOC109590782 isoform X1 [Amphimedon queenslandica]
MTPTDVEDALTYLHNCTIILYYPDIKPQLVFVDPRKILEILSQLLALTYVNKDTAQKVFEPKLEITWTEIDLLKNQGRFKENLLKKFTVFTGKFQPHYFINLLNKCHIIAQLQKKISQAEDVVNFLPSALSSYNGSFEKSPEDRKPLLYVWRKQVAREDVGKVFVDVPQGIFPLIIVRLLKQEECVVQLSNPDDVSQFRDAVSLLISFDKNDDDPNERLYIINRGKHIEVIFTGKKEQCPKINTLLCKVINESAENINISVKDLNIAFACRRDNSEYCIIKDEADQKTACRSKPAHTCTLDDSYWCWFNTSGSEQKHTISGTEGSGIYVVGEAKSMLIKCIHKSCISILTLLTVKPVLNTIKYSIDEYLSLICHIKVYCNIFCFIAWPIFLFIL